MFPRSFIVIAILGVVLIFLAWSPFMGPSVGEPIVLPPEDSSPTAIPPAASTTPSADAVSANKSHTPSFTVTQRSNCYNGPGVGYSVVAAVEAGDILQVVGRTQDHAWWRTSLKDSVICWIANEAGTFTGEAARIPITSSQYATKPVTPTRERPTAEPLQTKDPDLLNPTASQVEPTNTNQPVINTPIPATPTPAAPANSTNAPATNTAAPQINEPQPAPINPPVTNPPTQIP